MIRPVVCFALEKGVIVGAAMSFSFYIIIKTFSNFLIYYGHTTHSYLCLATIFETSWKNITKFPKKFFPEIDKSVLLFINHI